MIRHDDRHNNIICNYIIMRKVIVFDLDETLGHFVQLSEYDMILANMYNKYLSKDQFYKVMELFPNILRPGILDIMKMIKKEKEKQKEKIKVMIYTNNTGCKMWVHRLKGFIEKKINYKIFDRVICGWKHDGKIIEPNRSGYFKTYTDLLKCGHLSKKDKILFLDDRIHKGMLHKNISYLRVTPYRYGIPKNEFLTKYNSITSLKEHQQKMLREEVSTMRCNYTKSTNLKLYQQTGKKIKRHIEIFLKKNESTERSKHLKKTKKHVKRHRKNKTTKR